ncbi:LytR/AlgR family response regulator transcription factor [Chryseolinea lacunae]|uniref:Response regulator transcription factor n=1 Tax=Chryseolinea lacunae TaxID=2801331 RepID=A0ABS1L2T5_9BACT|nr:LytTR family DNA-binding domain-containing protein [Chryseolinea lacunae]MBL0745880.1 response regulator transcription factor [Chryseolinea lacunae]
MINAVIIEDEPKAANELKDILEQIRKDIVIVKTMGSIEEASEWFQQNDPPDIIFSDIQLSDGLSFEIYKNIDLSSPIIFCTAFDEYTLKAFEANGISYLLKPMTPAKVEESLRKYDELKAAFSKRQPSANQLEALIRQLRPSYQTTLLINVRDKIMPVKAEDVAYLYYNNGVVSVYLFNQQQYFIQETMDDLESKLNPSTFFRVNRQYLIHRNSIQEIERYFSRKFIAKLFLKTPEPIIVSKIKATPFMNWIKESI